MKQFSFLLAPLAALSALGCLAPPPCPEPNTASAANAAVASDGAAAPAAAADPADPGDLSKPLVVWNGDEVAPTAKEWASCDTKPCSATLLPTAKVGKNDSIGLEFKASVKGGYVGFGWNWTSWYKPGANNITGRKALKFAVKFVPASPEMAPAADNIRVGIRCAKAEKCGKVVPSLAKYDPKVLDGQWHDITIPLADMKPEDKDEWDDASVWEFGLHNWAPTPRDFVAYIDDIRFE